MDSEFTNARNFLNIVDTLKAPEKEPGQVVKQFAVMLKSKSIWKSELATEFLVKALMVYTLNSNNKLKSYNGRDKNSPLQVILQRLTQILHEKESDVGIRCMSAYLMAKMSSNIERAASQRLLEEVIVMFEDMLQMRCLDFTGLLLIIRVLIAVGKSDYVVTMLLKEGVFDFMTQIFSRSYKEFDDHESECPDSHENKTETVVAAEDLPEVDYDDSCDDSHTYDDSKEPKENHCDTIAEENNVTNTEKIESDDEGASKSRRSWTMTSRTTPFEHFEFAHETSRNHRIPQVVISNEYENETGSIYELNAALALLHCLITSYTATTYATINAAPQLLNVIINKTYPTIGRYVSHKTAIGEQDSLTPPVQLSFILIEFIMCTIVSQGPILLANAIKHADTYYDQSTLITDLDQEPPIDTYSDVEEVDF